MRKELHFICAAALVLAGTTAFAGARAPEWTQGFSKQYPAATYLVGVGVSDSLDGARANSRAEIAKIFRARVVQTAQETSSEKQTLGKGAGYSAANESAIATNVSTDGVLEGVEIAETYFDKKSKMHYALALLEKAKARTRLAAQLTEREETLQAEIAGAARTRSALEQVRALSRALAVSNEREELLARKRIVDPVAAADVPAVSRGEIERKRAEAMKRIVFVIKAQGDAPEVREAVAERVTKMGFAVAESARALPAGGSLIETACTATIAPSGYVNPQWKFYDWSANAVLKDTAVGTDAFATIQEQGRSAQLSEESARRKAAVDVAQALGAAVEREIQRYVFGSTASAQ